MFILSTIMVFMAFTLTAFMQLHFYQYWTLLLLCIGCITLETKLILWTIFICHFELFIYLNFFLFELFIWTFICSICSICNYLFIEHFIWTFIWTIYLNYLFMNYFYFNNFSHHPQMSFWMLTQQFDRYPTSLSFASFLILKNTIHNSLRTR